MFQKMKKSKGFTLIEMLVVIAIIAVLVAIIIPTVGSATTKATAAANAANLRSLKAEITTAYLTNDTSRWTFNADGTITAGTGVDTDIFKTANLETEDSTGFVATYSANDITVEYNGMDIGEWADVAGGKIADPTTT